MMTLTDAQRQMLQTKGVVLGRALMGLLFVVSGIGIGTNPAGTLPLLVGMGLPAAGLLLWIIVIFKIVAGGLLIIGKRVGLAAAGLIIFTFLTIVLVHNDLSNQNDFIASLKNLAVIGGLLYVMAFGAGSWNAKAAASAPVQSM
ncbi:MAG: DoxX family protein [Patescibacteria group bacterium]